MTRVIEFPKIRPVSPAAPPELDAGAVSAVAKPDLLVAESQSQLFRRVVKEVVKLIEACEEIISEDGK